MSVQTTLFGYKNVLHVYLPLSSSPGMTISYFCHDAKRGGRGPSLNVIMTLIVWKCPFNRSFSPWRFISSCIYSLTLLSMQLQIGLRNFLFGGKTVSITKSSKSKFIATPIGIQHNADFKCWFYRLNMEVKNTVQVQHIRACANVKRRASTYPFMQ